MGIALVMDDFGTGHSSLSVLRRFPIDMLKIDRSFVTNMEKHRDFTAVIYSIILLAQNLNMKVVAEGVETSEQLAQWQAMDCDYAQGFLFSKPLDADQALSYLSENHSAAGTACAI